MFYGPVYSSVSEEMIYRASDYYTSAFKYTDDNIKAAYVDLGCGSGKTLIQACSTNRFDLIAGVELIEFLASRCRKNMKIMGFSERVSVILGDVTSNNWSSQLKEQGIKESDFIFIFNKNSYGPDILRSSIEVAQGCFSNIIYLYQNPVHKDVLIDMGFKEFAKDASKENAHKNFKYSLLYRMKKD